jgi:hypothetical protein
VTNARQRVLPEVTAIAEGFFTRPSRSFQAEARIVIVVRTPGLAPWAIEATSAPWRSDRPNPKDGAMRRLSWKSIAMAMAVPLVSVSVLAASVDAGQGRSLHDSE